eukprot:2236926-Amphidinium_carterae.3
MVTIPKARTMANHGTILAKARRDKYPISQTTRRRIPMPTMSLLTGLTIQNRTIGTTQPVLGLRSIHNMQNSNNLYSRSVYSLYGVGSPMGRPIGVWTMDDWHRIDNNAPTILWLDHSAWCVTETQWHLNEYSAIPRAT